MSKRLTHRLALENNSAVKAFFYHPHSRQSLSSLVFWLLVAGIVGTLQPCGAGSSGFVRAGQLQHARIFQQATLLADGRVLIEGGVNRAFSRLASAELYDPATESWSDAGSMTVGRSNHTATLLASGLVLVTGSLAPTITPAELYDPVAGSWSVTGTPVVDRRYAASATLLPDGTVLVIGGGDLTGSYLTSAELYRPNTGTWELTGSLINKRAYHTATSLSNGDVLVVGGLETAFALTASAEIYHFSTGQWSATGSLATARWVHSARVV